MWRDAAGAPATDQSKEAGKEPRCSGSDVSPRDLPKNATGGELHRRWWFLQSPMEEGESSEREERNKEGERRRSSR